MKKSAFFVSVVLAGISFAPSLYAEDILARMKVISQQNGHNAQTKEAKVQTEITTTKNNLLIAAHDAENNAKDALIQALASGKAAIINQLTCTVVNVKDHSQVSGAMDLKGSTLTDNKYLKIGSLFPKDVSRKDLALAYDGGVKSDGFQFQLVDLANGAKVVRSGGWKDLGLDDLESACDSSQKIVTMNDGDLRVDTDKIKQLVTHGVVNAVHDGASSVVEVVKTAPTQPTQAIQAN